MLKLVVLSALLAVAVAAPGYLTGAHLGYTATVAAAPIATAAIAAPVAIPAAHSYSRRTDIISTPIVKTYTAAAPAAVAASVLPVARYAYSAPILSYSGLGYAKYHY